MRDESDWSTIADSSPENRKLAEILRLVEGVYGGCSPVDWQKSRIRCAQIFNEFYESDKASQELTALLVDTDYEVGGDEHHLVNFPSQPDCVFKLTHGDAFGCYSRFSPVDPDLKGKHFHGSINDDPAFYLKRWMLLNSFSGFQTRFEGLLPPHRGLRLHRICVSQPVLTASNPTEKEIQNALGRYGFRKISQDAFLNADSGILLTDAAPRNVRIIDEVPVPFDAICTMALSEVIEWACRPASRPMISF